MHPCDERPVWAEEDRSGQSSARTRGEPATALIDDAMLIVGMCPPRFDGRRVG